MRIARMTVLPSLMAAATAIVLSQTPAPPAAAPGLGFDVVSIKPNTTAIGPVYSSGITSRADGITAVSVPVSVLIARAYAPAVPADMVGLPPWSTSERYDVTATSTRSNATADERTAMLRAMLADRFQLVVHFENRETPVYDLVLARSDGRLGPGLTRSDTDCETRRATERAAAAAAQAMGTPPSPPQRPDLNAPPPPCQLFLRTDRLDGEGTMADLGFLFRAATGRQIVDKTGLTGTFRVTMHYDPNASRRGPATGPPALDAAPSVFTAVQEQIGMRLESSTAERQTLIVERVERPTAN